MASGVSNKPLLARIFQRLPKSSATHVPFRVRCACGQSLTGTRRKQALELVCPKCSAKVLVLPRSAWPVVASSAVPPTEPSATLPTPALAARRSRLKVWLLPMCAGLFALATAIWAIWVYGPQVARSARQDRRSVREHLAAAQEALQRGEFERATQELEGTARAWQRDGNAPSRDEQAAHYRLLNQTRLLTELCPQSLEEVLTIAEEEEKKPRADRTDLRIRLPQRVVVFDTHLHLPMLLENAHTLRLDYQVFGKTLPTHVDFSNQEGLLKLMPQDKLLRWVFAVRLESVQLRVDEENRKGHWVIRFEANSAVLLTDPRLFQVWGLHGDVVLSDVLGRQHREHILAPRLPFQEEPVLAGATREQVRAKLQEPDSIARQLWRQSYIEQWHYSQRRWKINLQSNNRAAPRVVAQHQLDPVPRGNP
jgi:hypothetical protein